jgi:hypothetical protein
MPGGKEMVTRGAAIEMYVIKPGSEEQSEPVPDLGNEMGSPANESL